MQQGSTLLKADVSGGPQFNWRLFYLLWGLASFGLLASIPYVLTLQQNKLQMIPIRLPLTAVISVEAVIQILIFGALTGIGLWIAEKVGLGAPVLANWLAGRPVVKDERYTWLPTILLGLAVSAIVVFLDNLVFSPMIQQQLQSSGQNLAETIKPPAWEGLLASFYGGFTEEILLRLFLMSLLLWIGNRLFHHRARSSGDAVAWTANVLTAMVFGLAHLPAAIAIGLPLSALGITRILILNALPGMVFGWLYWKRGLGSAMLAHFSGDLLIHVITPLILFP